MRLIETAMHIRAPAARVWAILTDFSAYPGWNPFITAAEGEHRPMTFRPVVLVVTPEYELRWLGRLLMPGLFDGEHAFGLEQQAETCQFLHAERFSGVLLPLLGEGLFEVIRRGFEAMNTALKLRAETS